MNTSHPTIRCAAGAGLVRALAVRGLAVPLHRGMPAFLPATPI